MAFATLSVDRATRIVAHTTRCFPQFFLSLLCFFSKERNFARQVLVAMKAVICSADSKGDDQLPALP